MKAPYWILLIGAVPVAHGVAETPVSVDAEGLVRFHDIDSDDNGYVSRVEARSVAAVENAFDSVDVDGNGLLDRAEYTSVRLAREAE
jgi:hypothetical protein